MKIKEVTPTYIRMAVQSAAGRGIKAPSPDWEEYIAKFLNGLVEADFTESK